MNITILANGNLEMSADVLTIGTIKNLRKIASCELEAESIFISECLGENNTSNQKEYSQVAPEEVRGLTSAPIISDGDNVYGYMDYQIKNFLEELVAGKTIVWQKGYI